jgi:hypothetical protein
MPYEGRLAGGGGADAEGCGPELVEPAPVDVEAVGDQRAGGRGEALGLGCVEAVGVAMAGSTSRSAAPASSAMMARRPASAPATAGAERREERGAVVACDGGLSIGEVRRCWGMDQPAASGAAVRAFGAPRRA